MHEEVIYADLTFLVNFILDSLILMMVSKVILKRIFYLRIFIAAILGGFYATLYLSPEFSLNIIFSLWGKIIVSLLMIIIALKPDNKQDFLKVVICFYGLCFITVGASIAVNYLPHTYNKPPSLHNLSLLAGIIAIIVISYLIDKYMQKTLLPLLHYDVEIVFEQKICKGKGFMDTGNGLIDPLTNKAVIVAEFKYLQEFLPEDISKLMQSITDEQELLDLLVTTNWANRLRMIPFTSIGKRNGILIGFRANSITIKSSQKISSHNDLVIALYRDRLSSGGEYQFIIPLSIL